jgi:hypothetical protein
MKKSISRRAHYIQYAHMAVPSRNDINVHDSLDERSACEHFLGKTIEQAEALFRENFLFYQEDLMWMGPAAFRYYIQAAINYIQSEASTGDSAIVNCLTSLLEFRLEQESSELEPVAEKLAALCGYILDHYRRFDLAPDLYPNVQPRLCMLRETFLRMQTKP